MIEFLRECFAGPNLPATLLLVVVLCYWLLVIFGLLGMDVFDFDLDADADIDVGMDGELDGGWFSSLADFFSLGDVPIVMVGSFFAFFYWIATMVSNHYLNEELSYLVTMIWLIPNVVVSLLLTKVSIMPLSSLFKNYDQTDDPREEMIGVVGIVKTSEVTDSFGQVEISQDVVINARTATGVRLGQGDAAKIISYNQVNGTYLVELSKWEKV